MSEAPLDDYTRERKRVADQIARIERIHTVIKDLQKRWASVFVDADGGDGDVELAVNYKGRLVSLSFAEGCTTRYTAQGLEELINQTLQAAVEAAGEETAEIEEEVNEAAAKMVSIT